MLIAPKDFSLLPAAATLDVRKQIGVLERQLSRIDGIDQALGAVPEDVSFSLDRDERGVPRRDPVTCCATSGGWRPATRRSAWPPARCATCAGTRRSGTTGALGKSVREEAGGIETVAKVLRYAYEKDPVPGPGGPGRGRRHPPPRGSAAPRPPWGTPPRGDAPVTTLTSLARIEAADLGRAQLIRTVRHVHVSDRPLVFIPLQLAGEPCAPLAAMVAMTGRRRGC